ncbi:MAG: single-stranded-DNA-specific exonuclease RecJ [Desulfamplus sp.]|nr:single-stranded-DNA-specific exonuclease RecJ [Desulfamplus sp.]
METRWQILNPDPEKIDKISKVIGCNEIVSKLLVNRGIKTPEEAFKFLNPSFEHLTEPFLLKDMQKAVERIYTAICNKERILIFGDFDADGITATTTLNDFFSYVGADVSWYIPHRIKEGYSLKLQHIDMAVKQRCDLLITVDCGSDSHEAVKAATKEDIDIIITDHHEISNSPPPAYAIVNPKQQGCQSGLSNLAGVGVAFYLVVALRSYLRSKGFWEDISEPNLVDYCDLFAIGTIADMVPLKAENRILSRAGISTIKRAKRVGLNSLINSSGIDQRYINSDDIAFKIAPKINAAGRISHSRICVDLLSEKSSSKAEQTAFILEELNKRRQELERAIIEDIENRIIRDPNIIKKASIVMADRSWSQGVLGIAASRVAKKYFCPVVLISTAPINANNALNSNLVTGSCRSIGTINIHDALSKSSDLLESFGGHKMAAGISIKPENIEKFSENFNSAVLSLLNGEDDLTKSEMVFDTHLNFNEITDKLLNEIDMLRPFGTDNPEPFFCTYNVKVLSSIMIASKHRKMVLEQISSKDGQKSTIDAMQFNAVLPMESDTNIIPNRFDKIAFKLKIDRFSGKNKPQIVIESV